MAKTANINLRVEPEVKREAEELFGIFGISVSDAITMFLNVSIMQGGLPFELKQPQYNATTEQAIAETKAMMEGTRKSKQYSSPRELFTELDAEGDD